MAHVFNIAKNSNLPFLTMQLNNDGRYNFKKFYYAIQNSTVTFTMWNQETGIKKIANSPAYIIYDENSECEERYLIQYRWNNRDTNESGKFIGQFKIDFNDDIIEHLEDSDTEVFYPTGTLIMPICDDLVINITDGTIQK